MTCEIAIAAISLCLDRGSGKRQGTVTARKITVTLLKILIRVVENKIQVHLTNFLVLSLILINR